MRHYILTEQQRAYAGYTDLFVIKADSVLANSDLSETTDNTDMAITLDALAYGDLVKSDICLEVRTAIANASANMTLAVSLGVTSATTQFLAATTLTSSGTVQTEGTAGHIIVPIETVIHYATPSGGKNLILTLDITDADGAFSDITTGELWVWANISRIGNRNLIRA